MNKVSILRIELFKHSKESFILALDSAGIDHEPMRLFSMEPQNSSVTETISALSEAMPWNSIAKVMIAWIEARKSREIIVTTEDQKIIHLKGYSVTDAEKILKLSINAVVIDTKPVEKN